MSQATYAECNHASSYSEAVCLTCCAHWCDECDPAPSALCHYCHGRGYSTALIEPPAPTVRYMVYFDAAWGTIQTMVEAHDETEAVLKARGRAYLEGGIPIEVLDSANTIEPKVLGW